jgi:glutathione S-transferase
MYDLYIANKNYSSWSLRPWVLARQLEIPFREHLIQFGHESSWQSFRKFSPSGRVPCLVDGDTVVWDSLAIAEYLAERHPTVWPARADARAWARCAAAEMHSSFGELRNRCSMTCGQRIKLNEYPASLESDVARLQSLWNDGLRRFRGPYLAGPEFTAVDAFFAPVAFRIQSYAIALDAESTAYVTRLLGTRAMREWYAAAVKETFRDAPHEEQILTVGKVIEDVRAT